VLGALLLLLGGGWITFAILRRPPAQGASAEEPESRASTQTRLRIRRTGTE
jgi:hypothetical protein